MITFKKFGEIVLARRETQGIRGIRSEHHRWSLHILKAEFASLSIDQVKATHIRAWIRDMLSKPANDTRGERTLHPGSIKRCLSLVSTILAAAVEEELRADNPCHGIKVPKLTDERATKESWTYLTPDEQRAFVESREISEADRLAILFALYTGVRQGEQFNSLLSDLHVEGDAPYFYVRFGSKNKPPKSGKARTVYLNGKALAVAKRWLQVLPTHSPRNPENLVFPTPNGKRRGVGKPLGRVKVGGKHICAWSKAKVAVGITRRLRWHDLRHTTASSLIAGWWDRKWSMKETQDLLGHSSVMITERYAHLDKEVLKNAARETGAATESSSSVHMFVKQRIHAFLSTLIKLVT